MKLLKKVLLSLILTGMLINTSGIANVRAEETTVRHADVISFEKTGSITVIAAGYEEKALEAAKRYISILAFSKKGLIEQLKFDGFTTKEAKYAVKKLNVNWKAQAVKKAESYLEILAFSKKGLRI